MSGKVMKDWTRGSGSQSLGDDIGRKSGRTPLPWGVEHGTANGLVLHTDGVRSPDRSRNAPGSTAFDGQSLGAAYKQVCHIVLLIGDDLVLHTYGARSPDRSQRSARGSRRSAPCAPLPTANDKTRRESGPAILLILHCILLTPHCHLTDTSLSAVCYRFNAWFHVPHPPIWYVKQKSGGPSWS
jgi:hypothetical protein